MQPR